MFSNSLRVFAHTFGSSNPLLFLCMSSDTDLFTFFYMWLSSFPVHIVEETVFHHCVVLPPCHRLIDHSCMVLF